MKLIDIYQQMNHQNNILQEANLKRLYTKSVSETPRMAQRGKSMYNKVRYFGLSKDGTLNFKINSASFPGKFYYVYIEAPDILKFGDLVEQGNPFTVNDLSKLLTMDQFRIHCNDPSFLYWAFQYMATQGNYEIEPETRAPKRNNTTLKGGLCKHLCAVVDNIYSNQKIREAISRDINNYLRMLSGLDYEDYQQLNHAKQIQQQNRAVKWKNNPSDFMNDYFARQAKKHPFLDDHDIKKSLKSEMNKFIKAQPYSTTDDFLRDYFGMTQKAFADDMGVPETSITDYFDELGFTDKKEKAIDKLVNKNTNVGTKSGILTKDSEQLKESDYWKTLRPAIEDTAQDWKAVDDYKEKIKNGYSRPILINDEGDILDGNHTMTAYQELEIKPPLIYKGTRKDFLIAAGKANGDALKAVYQMIDDGQAELIKESEEQKSYLSPKEAHEKYQEYLEGHIGNVIKATDLIIKCCQDNEFIQEEQETLRNIAKDHDKSKYEEAEYIPYLHHFYPTKPEEEQMTEEFELACKHHILSNKHHWDFWIDQQTLELQEINDDDREYKLYCVERVADWLSMAAQHDEDKSIWYETNKKSIKMPDWAFEFIDYIYSKLPDDYYLSLSFKGTRGELDESERMEELI